MLKKSTILIALAALSILNTASARAASPKSFFRSRAIELKEIDKGSLVAVPLADDVYLMLQPTFSDLRVFDDQNGPTASVIRKIPSQTKEYQLPPEAIDVRTDKGQNKATTITLETGNRPIDRIEFQTPARNFERQVVLFASPSYSNHRDWRKVHVGKIKRIDLGDVDQNGVDQESLTMTFPELRSVRLQIRIEHGANRPIEIEKVRLFGPTYECRFIAEPERSYTLEYGSTADELPPLDMASLDAAERNHLTPIAGRLSDQILQRKTIDRKDYSVDHVFTNPYIVYPTIGFLIFLMSLGLLFAARRMPSSKEEKKETDS